MRKIKDHNNHNNNIVNNSMISLPMNRRTWSTNRYTLNNKQEHFI